MRRQAALALLCGSWFAAAAFAPGDEARLDYDFAGVSELPVEPGRQYPPRDEDKTLAPAVPRPQPSAGGGADWSLNVDASVTADSNRNNGSSLSNVAIDTGGQWLPVPVDPSLRKTSGVGLGLSAAAAVKVPVAPNAKLTAGAEGYVLDYPGGRSDDSLALGSAGVELSGEGATASAQLIAFDRSYGGVSAMRGWGLRANYRRAIGDNQHIALYLDGRLYDSGYGPAFDGKQGGVWLAYDIVLDPTLTAAGGLYVRRDDLRSDAFSSTEFGAYGSLTHYLSDDLTGGLSAGIGRVIYDAPILALSPDPRRDWRGYASLYVTTRRPVAWGIFPSLTYTYNRTASSVDFYSLDRHRLRLGLTRGF